jgi:5'-deoxynucleotidase YfbR-like HD superfamily hydrolase
VVESVADHSWRVGVLALTVAGGAGKSSLRGTNLRKKKKKRRKC